MTYQSERLLFNVTLTIKAINEEDLGIILSAVRNTVSKYERHSLKIVVPTIAKPKRRK